MVKAGLHRAHTRMQLQASFQTRCKFYEFWTRFRRSLPVHQLNTVLPAR